MHRRWLSARRPMGRPMIFGYGAMFNRQSLWPAPPKDFANDVAHKQWVDDHINANVPLAAQAGMRAVSWPWGVTFSTFGVNWENGIGGWSARRPDRAPGSGWYEKQTVGIDELWDFADMCSLDAVVIGTPLGVWDGNVPRWGPQPWTYKFDEKTIGKAVDHCLGMVDHLSAQDTWGQRQVFIEAGCEWRPFQSFTLSDAAKTYGELCVRLADELKPDEQITVVASGAETAEFGGLQALKAAAWNRPLYETIVGHGVAVDLHKYRSVVNSTASKQHGFFTVDPKQWGGKGPRLKSVVFEQATTYPGADVTKDAQGDWPDTAIAADLAMRAAAEKDGVLCYLAWCWGLNTRPSPWSYGIVRPDGTVNNRGLAHGGTT